MRTQRCDPATSALADVVKALADRQPAVVAIADGHMVGSAVGRIDGDMAWVLRLALDPKWRGTVPASMILCAERPGPSHSTIRFFAMPPE